MQLNGSKYLIISLGILVTLSAGLFFFGMESSKPAVDHDHFKVADLEKIDKVVLISPKDTVELKFNGSRWRVNGTWDADPQMIEVFFATVRQAEPRRPVSASIRDSVRTLLDKQGVHVTLYEGERQEKWIAGGNALKTEAWFMKEGEREPYVMNIPGYRVYVSGVFELAAQGWRNKRIFDFNWRNFKSLKATYPKEPRQGFEIEMKDRYFGIKNMMVTDTTKLNTYLDNVSLLFASRFVDKGQPYVDSLVSTLPAARIEISDITGHGHLLELFAPGKRDREIYGRLADGQIVALEKNKIAEIVRKKEYFLPNQAH
jgi:hypothetical protein